jgi:hypothetical protein
MSCMPSTRMRRTTSTLGSDMRRLSDLTRGGSCPPSSPRPWTSLPTRAIHSVCLARWTGYRFVVRFDPVRSVPCWDFFMRANIKWVPIVCSNLNKYACDFISQTHTVSTCTNTTKEVFRFMSTVYILYLQYIQNMYYPEPVFVNLLRESIPSLASRYDNPIWHTSPPGYICWRNRFLGIRKRLQIRPQVL